LRLCMRRGEPQVVSVTDTISSLPGGRSCSTAMTGESLVQEVDSRIGRPTAGVPLTRRLCMLEESPCQEHVGGGPTGSAVHLLLGALAGHGTYSAIL
jgi:hypothetical protein